MTSKKPTMRISLTATIVAAAFICGCQNPPTQTGQVTSPKTQPAADNSTSRQKAKAMYNDGLALQKKKSMNEALATFRAAIECDPTMAEAINHLAWTLATYPDEKIRDPKEALRLSQQANALAVENQPPSKFGADCIDTLAVAYAANGDFDGAIRHEKRAIEMVDKLGLKREQQEFRGRLELLEQRKSFIAGD